MTTLIFNTDKALDFKATIFPSVHSESLSQEQAHHPIVPVNKSLPRPAYEKSSYFLPYNPYPGQSPELSDYPRHEPLADLSLVVQSPSAHTQA